MLYAVYFDQPLGAENAKKWSKLAFLKSFWHDECRTRKNKTQVYNLVQELWNRFPYFEGWEVGAKL